MDTKTCSKCGHAPYTPSPEEEATAKQAVAQRTEVNVITSDGTAKSKVVCGERVMGPAIEEINTLGGKILGIEDLGGGQTAILTDLSPV
jgi:hypothetical protein